MDIECSQTSPPAVSLLVAEFLKCNLKIKWGTETKFTLGKETFSADRSIARLLVRISAAANKLYGTDNLSTTEVDHWLDFASLRLACDVEQTVSLDYLERVLAPSTYLVGEELSLADLAVWAELRSCPHVDNPQYPNIRRYYKHLSSIPEFQRVSATLPQTRPAQKAEKKGATSTPTEAKKKDEGKFIELEGAKEGEVVVRFPPEASGYLHIGHAKAALLNQYYQQTYKGKLIMRFDDTNPAKENADFEKIILEDVKLLGITYDILSYTSNHFELMLTLCEKMIKGGNAFTDDTDGETMKLERSERANSKNRDNDVAKNLSMWTEMKAGTAYGQTCCVRAKIDMGSDNGCMRDPTIYRCKPEIHPHTGDKYKVYPTYDFACPIVDSVEGVTHALRTTEYHDRDDQYFWFIEKLGLRKVHVWEYSRLNLQHTVLSKRKLTWFVAEGHVTGWDDPRFPTVRGVMRRGMTVEGLKQFIIAQGGSRSVVTMEWDKIWSFNKKVIDPIAPRYFALLRKDIVPVYVEGATESSQSQPRHPKNAEVGEKIVYYSSKVYIEGADAESFKEEETVTFINWGNLIVKEVKWNSAGRVESVQAKLNLENKDYKKTAKVTWLADHSEAVHVSAQCVHYGDLMTKPVLAPGDDFKDFINHDSKTVYEMLGDPCLADLKKGDVIQLQRRGYYICDQPAGPLNIHTCTQSPPCVLINIPDGHQKEMPTAGSKHKSVSFANAAKDGKSGSGGGKEKKAKMQTVPPAVTGPEIGSTAPSGGSALDLHKKIVDAGNTVRDLKSAKAVKPDIEAAVKMLLSLKADYKSATGQEYKPGITPPPAVSQSVAPSSTIGQSASDTNDKIAKQGVRVRQLKSEKAAKPDIEAAVKMLLSLKADYKSATGQEWKPGITPPPAVSQSVAPASTISQSAADINDKIAKQGDRVRQLKSEKAAKPDIEAAVKTLLSLKADYKSATGQEYKPGITPPPAVSQSGAPASTISQSAADINDKIAKQGDLVRKLKSEKAAKCVVQEEVSQLLALKTAFKSLTGGEWKADSMAAAQAKAAPASNGSLDSGDKITAQGDLVRRLKSEKATKADVDAAVKTLLELKAEYKTATGSDWKVAGGQNGSRPKKEKQPKQETKKPEKSAASAATGDREVKKTTKLGLLASKEDNLSDWYSQIITKSEMIEYYDVSGCYILRPWSYVIWEKIKEFLDAEIKKLGVENCYFPIFVSNAALEKEKDHIADFAPEVAWVTKSGSTDLAEPIAIRPTSETVMYPAYAKWIQSHRDLPMKLNQWNNVVRWEFKHPQPFLRTREFLWQEGHTTFSNAPEAQQEVLDILELYARVYEEYLAIPVVRGRKTEKEKFAGADYTTTVEAYISASGRAIQGGTSHHLGQNFSKMFNIVFEDPETQKPEFVWQNSWGLTTRTIGVLVMVHGDNKGLVLPPKVASIQAVIIPCGITASLPDVEKNALLDSCKELEKSLATAGVAVKADLRDNYSPGWKFNHWELKGVPLRIEMGPRDMAQRKIVVVRRDTGDKLDIKRAESVGECQRLLDTIQTAMYNRAHAEQDSHIVTAHTWAELCSGLDKKYLLLSPFCGEISCEESIKKDSARDVVVEEGAPAMGAKGLCIPFKQPGEITPEMKCVYPDCTRKPKYYTLFGRSY